jgi:hypothetical protein
MWMKEAGRGGGVKGLQGREMFAIVVSGSLEEFDRYQRCGGEFESAFGSPE